MGPRWVLPFVAALLLASPAAALTDEEIFRDLRFNLINPGARALAMGGAFVSLANDATAAQANPAGLGMLSQSEYFAELRYTDNAAEASVIRETLPAGIDTFVATGTETEDVLSPTFLSVVRVFKHWTLGLSYHEMLNIESSTVSTFAFTFPDSPGAFFVEGTGSVEMTVRNLNISGGVKLNDQWSLGATVTVSRLDVAAEVVNTIVDTEGNIAPDPILEPELDLRTSIDGADEDVTFAAGVIYKRPMWGAGAVYRRGPRFSVTESIDPPQDIDDDGELEGFDLFGVRGRLGIAFLNEFALPDSFGIGGHWVHFEEHFTLSANIERILYSNLLDRYVAGVNVLTGPDAEFDIDDGTDYRLGLEYVFFNSNNSLPPIAVRAGTFLESDTTITATSLGNQGFATAEVFQGRDDQLHGTVGVGFVFGKGEVGKSSYKLDLAADVADTDNEYLVSFIYRGK